MIPDIEIPAPYLIGDRVTVDMPRTRPLLERLADWWFMRRPRTRHRVAFVATRVTKGGES